MARRRQEKCEKEPLRIPQLACVLGVIAQILSAGDFSPRHCDLHRIFANPTESQRTEITQFFFGQTLRRSRRACAPSDRLEGWQLSVYRNALRRPALAPPVVLGGAERLALA